MRACRFRCGSEPFALSLATRQNSLVRFSTRTTGRCSTRLRGLRRFHALAVCNRLVSGPFHLPSGVLCSFRSRYYCAIGLESYLGLDVGGTQFARDIRPTLLRIPGITHASFPYAAITLYGAPFQGTSGPTCRVCPGPQLHISRPLLAGFGLPCAVFRRPY